MLFEIKKTHNTVYTRNTQIKLLFILRIFTDLLFMRQFK